MGPDLRRAVGLRLDKTEGQVSLTVKGFQSEMQLGDKKIRTKIKNIKIVPKSQMCMK